MKDNFIDITKEETQFENTLKRYISVWKKEVDTSLTIAEHKISKAIEDLSPEDIEKIVNFKIGQLPKRLASLGLAAAQKGVERAYTDINVALTWNIDMTPVAEFYMQHYEEFSKILSQGLQDRVKEMISAAVRDGSPSQTVHQGLADIFDGPVIIEVPEKVVEGEVTRAGYTYEMDKDVYTTMVSRTEMQSALNNGRVYGYEQSGIAKTLRFNTNPGACEEFCVPLEGHIYTVEESMDVIPIHPNCLTSSNVPILTIDGWKAYYKLHEGDLVLTHKGQFKPIVKKIYSQGVPYIAYKFILSPQISISVTEEHPILTNNGWKLAKDVTLQDEFYTIATHEYKFVYCKVREIKRYQPKHFKRYNLEILDDESYIANGIVVHNCRCTWTVEEYNTYSEAHPNE